MGSTSRFRTCLSTNEKVKAMSRTMVAYHPRLADGHSAASSLADCKEAPPGSWLITGLW